MVTSIYDRVCESGKGRGGSAGKLLTLGNFLTPLRVRQSQHNLKQHSGGGIKHRSLKY